MPAHIQPTSDLINLSGQRALITGAAAGIGRAIALRFAEAGAALELADLDEKGLQKTVGMLCDGAAEARTHVLDVANREQRRAIWAKFGDEPPDVLINNAGIYPFKHFVDVDEAFYEKVMAVNLDSVYWMCQEMIKRRIKKGGVIINLGSIEALVPFKDDLAQYSVSKSGVIALTRALAREHGKDHFRINALLPGGILTEGTKKAAKRLYKLDFSLIKTGMDFRKRLPIGRLGKPEEVASVALFLASDLASYVHGAAIPVDGGFLTA